MHLDDPPRPVGHAVVVAADRDEAVVADAPFQLEQGVEGHSGQRLQVGLLGGEGLHDDPLRGAVQADVGDGIEPDPELSVQIAEVLERAGQEEVLADVGERSLDLALRFGPVGPAGAGPVAVVLGQSQQGATVDDVAIRLLARDGRLHAIVQDLHWHAADGGEDLDMTAHQGL